MKFEVIVQNGQEAIQAEQLGASQLELVSAIQEGGLTPSYGAIKQVLKSVSIPVHIMIRPHSHHFHYGVEDSEIIFEDIQNVLTLGGTHIVFGALNKDQTINTTLLDQIITNFPQLNITFHRAFDEVRCQQEAYDLLTTYKQHIHTILTSGGKEDCFSGRHQLKDLVQLSKKGGGPHIMPGAGLNVMNVKEVHEVVQANAYHFGRALRVDHSFANGFDEEQFNQIVKMMNQYKEVALSRKHGHTLK